MLQEIIEFLTQNPDIVQKVKEGTASLIGVSETQKQAILDIFSSPISYVTMSAMDYWK